jgi:3-dehydroquinate dehydratase
MTKPIYILNGPNLNRLGKREPEVYGTTTLAQIESQCREEAGSVPIEFRQSNSETELIDWIHEAIDDGAGIVINPAAFSFTSMAILDALKMFQGPIIEVVPSLVCVEGCNGGDRRIGCRWLSRRGQGYARNAEPRNSRIAKPVEAENVPETCCRRRAGIQSSLSRAAALLMRTMKEIHARLRGCFGALLSLALLPGCGGDDAASKQAGVSIKLRYPVLLIGQSSLDVRDSEQGLVSITGASSLNLNERTIIDSDGRLFKVKRAVPMAGQRSILWDMGTSARRFHVAIVEQQQPTWLQVQELVIAQLHSPTSVSGDERAVTRVRAMRDVPELIAASRESWSWAR